MRPILAMIIPVGDGGGGYPDNSLPPGFGGRPDNSLPGGGPVDPGYGRPIFHPGHPDHGLPSQPGHPGNRPPGSGRPDRPGNDLPWAPGRPDNSLPGSGGPVDPGWGGGWGGGPHPGNRPPGSWDGSRPDNSLPGAQPKAYSAAIPPTPPTSVNTEEGVWVIVDVNGTLAWAWAQKPESQPGIDNTLPEGRPSRPDNELPEAPEPK